MDKFRIVWNNKGHNGICKGVFYSLDTAKREVKELNKKGLSDMTYSIQKRHSRQPWRTVNVTM